MSNAIEMSHSQSRLSDITSFTISQLEAARASVAQLQLQLDHDPTINDSSHLLVKGLEEARQKVRAFEVYLGLVEDQARSVNITPSFAGAIIRVVTAKVPDMTFHEHPTIRRNQLRDSLPQWREAPDARLYDFTLHCVTDFPSLLPDGAQWVECACNICGANCTKKDGKIFSGFKGLWTHISLAHPVEAAKIIDKVLYIRRFCILRRLSLAEVEILLNGGRLEPEYKAIKGKETNS